MSIPLPRNARLGGRAGPSSKEEFRVCPKCQKMVKVGGPINHYWSILRHSPGDNVLVSCSGTEEKIPV